MKVCASAGCRELTRKRFCPKCQLKADEIAKRSAKKRARQSTTRSGDKYKSFYGSTAWKTLRERKLKQDPLCEDCKDNGFIRSGHDIDHEVEVKDDFSLRLDITNLRTRCRSCHMAKTARVRRDREVKTVGRMSW